MASEQALAKFAIQQLDKDKLEKAKSFLEKLLEYRRLKKLKTTYINGPDKALAITGNGKIYVEYRMDGTRTHRLSCAAYYAKPDRLGVSFHTLPRETQINIRSMFVPEIEGWKYITADFSGMEMRILAHTCEDQTLIEAFTEGDGDVHRFTASLIFGIPKSQVTKEQRQIAKAVSFLIVYGGGPERLVKTANVTLSVAEKTIEAYRQIYPGIFTWMDDIKGFVSENKYVETIFNRRRHFENVTSPKWFIREECFRQAINFMIQSPASDVLQFCMNDIGDYMYDEFTQAELTNQVHDSIEAVAPPEEVEKICLKIKDLMSTYPSIKKAYGYEFKVPLDVEIEVGPSFGEALECEFDENNRITNLEELLAYNG